MTVSVNLEQSTLGQLSSPIQPDRNGNGRKVKRYIHCSDGVYEEFSSDEEGVYQVPAGTSLVDPVSPFFQLKRELYMKIYFFCLVPFLENNDVDALVLPCVFQSPGCL
jgi:hypothetical protein